MDKKNVPILLSCLALAIFGGTLGYITKPSLKAEETPTIVTQYVSKADLPLDLQLDLAKTKPKDSVPTFEIKVDAQKPKEKVVYKYKTRMVRVPAEPDTMPVVGAKDSLATPGVRKEDTPDTIGHSKSSIILTVDGEEVYKRLSLRSGGRSDPTPSLKGSWSDISGGSHLPRSKTILFTGSEDMYTTHGG